MPLTKVQFKGQEFYRVHDPRVAGYVLAYPDQVDAKTGRFLPHEGNPFAHIHQGEVVQFGKVIGFVSDLQEVQ